MRDKLGRFVKGVPSWNKGIPCSEKTKRKNSLAHLGKQGYWKGKKFSKQHIKNLSLSHIGKLGKQASNWKGGKRISSHNYILIYSPKHPFRDAHNYVYEHRLIIEKHLGRHLKPPEIVHHINENTLDNRIENLCLCENLAKHRKLHKKT